MLDSRNCCREFIAALAHRRDLPECLLSDMQGEEFRV
jgi:hypothetical protein